MCHRSVGLIQNKLEEQGMITISITLKPEITFGTGVSRAAYMRYPLGNPFGPVNDQGEQSLIFQDLLQVLQDIEQPGSIIEMPYRWRKGRIVK